MDGAWTGAEDRQAMNVCPTVPSGHCRAIMSISEWLATAAEDCTQNAPQELLCQKKMAGVRMAVDVR